MKHKVFIILLVISVCINLSQSQVDGGFWWQDFVTPASTPIPTTKEPVITIKPKVKDNLKGLVCCECVPFYLCPNGTIITDGQDLLDVRIGDPQAPKEPIVNVDVCPDLDVCCPPPDVDPSCNDALYGPTLPPNTPCKCQIYNTCDPTKVVSNGQGTTSVHLDNGRIVSHSQCHHSLEVCCAVSDTPIVTDCECVEDHLCDDNGFIITDGGGLFDVRIKAPGFTGSPQVCPTDPSLLCCYHRPTVVDPPVTVHPPHPVTREPVHPVTDPNNCVCVDLFLCGPDGYIIQEGEGLVNVRGGFSSLLPCPYDHTLVCCLERDKRVVDPHIPACGYRNSIGVGVRGNDA